MLMCRSSQADEEALYILANYAGVCRMLLSDLLGANPAIA